MYLRENVLLERQGDEDLYFKAYITNLGKYNEGELVGKYVDFPIDEEAFEEELKSIGIGPEYEEWFVSDYESNLPISLGEYVSYETLQEWGEKIDEINRDGNALLVKNALEVNDDLLEVMDAIESGDIYFYEDVGDWGDLGIAIVEQIYGDDIPKDLINDYFDYEMLGRDIRLEFWDEEDEDMTAGMFWVGDDDASDQEIGEAYVDEVGIDGVSNVDYYFDYDAFGRALSYDGFTLTSDGAIEWR